MTNYNMKIYIVDSYFFLTISYVNFHRMLYNMLKREISENIYIFSIFLNKVESILLTILLNGKTKEYRKWRISPQKFVKIFILQLICKLLRIVKRVS